MEFIELRMRVTVSKSPTLKISMCIYLPRFMKTILITSVRGSAPRCPSHENAQFFFLPLFFAFPSLLLVTFRPVGLIKRTVQ